MNEMDLPEAHDSLPGYPAPAAAVDVLGHEAHEESLAKAYRAGKLHHALIFSGPQGIGKATFAFQFARYIIENPNLKSTPAMFGEAEDNSIVRQIAAGAHPQVLHLTRPLDVKTGKFKTQLTVEETKRIGRFLTRTVAGNGHRIVIVDPVNDMNASAANALLKNLEEPTPRTLLTMMQCSRCLKASALRGGYRGRISMRSYRWRKARRVWQPCLPTAAGWRSSRRQRLCWRRRRLISVQL